MGSRGGVCSQGWGVFPGEGSPTVVTVQSLGHFLISSRTEVKCLYPQYSTLKLSDGRVPTVHSSLRCPPQPLQICHFPFPPQRNGAPQPHGTPHRPVAECRHIYRLIRESQLGHSWVGRLPAAAARTDHVQTSSASSRHSRVKFS